MFLTLAELFSYYSSHIPRNIYLLCIFNMISVKLECLITFMSAAFESLYT